MQSKFFNQFAIKILQPQAPQNWAEVEREIEILRQIQHPSIFIAFLFLLIFLYYFYSFIYFFYITTIT